MERNSNPTGNSNPADTPPQKWYEPARAFPSTVADGTRLGLIWRIVKDVVGRRRPGHLSVVSAGCAYYALFAIFPALTASISLYGLIVNPETVERQFVVFQSILPPQAYGILVGEIKHIADTSSNTLGWALSAGLLVALWSAHRATQAMFTALNIAYGEPERRGVVHYSLAAFGYTLVVIVGGSVMLFVIVSVPTIFEYTGHAQVGEIFVRYLRWPIFFVLTLFLLALVYRFGPSREDPEWHWITPGSFLATVVWLLASFGFSYYVAHFGHYDKMYGSLGAVIILLFWLYISFYIVLVGAEINAAIERHDNEVKAKTEASSRAKS